MTPCHYCNKEASSVFYQHKDRVWACKACYEQPPCRYNPLIKHSWSDAPGSISVGHMEDIKHRVHDMRTGEVVRDVGRKYI